MNIFVVDPFHEMNGDQSSIPQVSAADVPQKVTGLTTGNQRQHPLSSSQVNLPAQQQTFSTSPVSIQSTSPQHTQSQTQAQQLQVPAQSQPQQAPPQTQQQSPAQQQAQQQLLQQATQLLQIKQEPQDPPQQLNQPPTPQQNLTSPKPQSPSVQCSPKQEVKVAAHPLPSPQQPQTQGKQPQTAQTPSPQAVQQKSSGKGKPSPSQSPVQRGTQPSFQIDQKPQLSTATSEISASSSQPGGIRPENAHTSASLRSPFKKGTSFDYFRCLLVLQTSCPSINRTNRAFKIVLIISNVARQNKVMYFHSSTFFSKTRLFLYFYKYHYLVKVE